MCHAIWSSQGFRTNAGCRHHLPAQRLHRKFDSMWAGLEIIPMGDHADLQQSLSPTDASGSHYFAARETDSDYLRSGSIPERSPKPEFEKFLFYRGVGNFTTPLKVTMTSDDAVTLSNTGSAVLPDLFVLTVKNHVRKFPSRHRLETRRGKIQCTPPSSRTSSLAPVSRCRSNRPHVARAGPGGALPA